MSNKIHHLEHKIIGLVVYCACGNPYSDVVLVRIIMDTVVGNIDNEGGNSYHVHAGSARQISQCAPEWIQRQNRIEPDVLHDWRVGGLGIQE